MTDPHLDEWAKHLEPGIRTSTINRLSRSLEALRIRLTELNALSAIEKNRARESEAAAVAHRIREIEPELEALKRWHNQ
jgi:hypothetical protein